jgi:hypothetical protein
MTHACPSLAAVDSAVLAAARARAPRKRPSPTPLPPLARNNYIAEGKAQAGLPAEASAKAGARPGNRNAWRHGRYGQAFRTRRAAMRALFAAQDRVMLAARLLANGPEPETAHRLFAACAADAAALGARFAALRRQTQLDSHTRFVQRMRTAYET